jgi:hypothetical protein
MSLALEGMEERFSQIEKTAADIQMFFGGETGTMKFVELQSTGWSPSEVGAVSANQYDGMAFGLGWEQESQSFVKTEEAGCKAYDLSIMRNDPTLMPEEARIVGADGLEIGTVVLGVEIAPGIVAFCSNRPRLQVECVEGIV